MLPPDIVYFEVAKYLPLSTLYHWKEILGFNHEYQQRLVKITAVDDWQDDIPGVMIRVGLQFQQALDICIKKRYSQCFEHLFQPKDSIYHPRSRQFNILVYGHEELRWMIQIPNGLLAVAIRYWLYLIGYVNRYRLTRCNDLWGSAFDDIRRVVQTLIKAQPSGHLCYLIFRKSGKCIKRYLAECYPHLFRLAGKRLLKR